MLRQRRWFPTPAHPIPARLLPVWLLVLTLATPAWAADPPALSLIGSENRALALTLPESGGLSLVFHRTGIDAAVFELDLGQFSTAQGEVGDLRFATAGAGPAELRFAPDQHRQTLSLEAGGLLPGQTYTGLLTASSAEGVLPPWTLSLTRQQHQARLVADVEHAELALTVRDPLVWLARLLGRSVAQPGLVISLSEASGEQAVEGLRLRRADTARIDADFDLLRHLRFSIDGVAVAAPTTWPVTDSDQVRLRRIEPGAQRALLVSVGDLPRGEHRMTLQLEAANVEAGQGPRIELQVRVRHSVIGPMLLLLLAILVSFFITKGVANWRQRLALFERTRSLRREWLNELGALAPLVWLKATRRQAELVLDRFSLLPAPGELATRLDKAARLLALLHRYRDLHHQLQMRAFPYMLDWRFGTELESIIAGVEPEMLDEAAATRVQNEFDRFEQDLIEPAPRYRPLVLRALAKARHTLALAEIGCDAPTRARLEHLVRTYLKQPPDENPSLAELVVIDRVCSSFRVLWRHRSEPAVLSELLGLIAHDRAEEIEIERVLEVSNRTVFAGMQQAVAEGEVELALDGQDLTALQALQPVRFCLRFGDRELDESFMAKTRMRADWRFSFVRPASRKQPAETRGWTKTAAGKTLVQFAPDEGELSLEVTVGHGRESAGPIRARVAVAPYGRSLTSRLFAIEETVLMLVSLAIAFASGLVLYYVDKPTFGSLQDYLALFTWGVGVDQGKNLVQTFQSLRSRSAAGADET